ncbi:MAG: glycoside hydrolase family 3 protein [Cyclobacteriaceae bacterium]|nr:glycoside hydrolase family 3 protein [Cyclobacteriaceae bacterium]
MKNISAIITTTLVLALTCLASQISAKEVDSLDIKIGQMLMVGFGGTHIEANDPLLGEIAKGNVGGVILFEKNIDPTDSYHRLKNLVFTLQKSANVPLFMAIDQEGGRVNRLKTKYGFPRSVTANYLGKLDNEDSTRYYAQTTAATLAGLGFNTNFAPVLDLAANPNNPIIAKIGRSYSAYPEMVAKHAAIIIKEHTRLHIITVGKHFPGHGSSKADTHKGMADVTNTWQENELSPYKILIDAGLLTGVMSAHIVNKNLDPSGLPGTLSEKILEGILRQRLGYDGVVFSDDMQMHAITKHYGIEKALELGINAGLDVVIYSNNIKASTGRNFDYLHSLIKKLVLEGKIKQERIDQSYKRIMKLKNGVL